MYVLTVTNKYKRQDNMRQYRYNNRIGSTLVERRVSLNNVILPPLPPEYLMVEGTSDFYHDGKTWVAKPKSAGVNGDLVQVRQNVSEGSSTSTSTSKPADLQQEQQQQQHKDENSRVIQLEHNIKFLQEQHQLMLSGLHQEIDNLRHRNRELQFQLVFVKGSSPSSPSSPEDESKPKVYSSPKQLNITPLQVELLEKELSEVKLNLQEIESRNVYLSAIADEQKKKLERYERERERERERSQQPDAEILRKLEDAEILIKRLRQENADLRRENGSSGGSSSSNNYQNQNKEHRGNGRGNRGYRGNYRGNWFPPLHQQNYWQNRSGSGGGGGGGNDGNIRTTTQNAQNAENITLPTIQNQNPQNQHYGHQRHHGGNKTPQHDTSTTNTGNNGQQQNQQQQQQQHYQGRRGSNNNHYHNGEGRKYRGQRGHKPS